jgi:hypothetical protein
VLALLDLFSDRSVSLDFDMSLFLRESVLSFSAPRQAPPRPLVLFSLQLRTRTARRAPSPVGAHAKRLRQQGGSKRTVRPRPVLPRLLPKSDLPSPPPRVDVSPTELASSMPCTLSREREQRQESSDSFPSVSFTPTALPASLPSSLKSRDGLLNPRELREHEPTRSYRLLQWCSDGAQLAVHVFDELSTPPSVQLLPRERCVKGTSLGRVVPVSALSSMDKRFTSPECFTDRKVEWES